jgi:hypothetical protein
LLAQIRYGLSYLSLSGIARICCVIEKAIEPVDPDWQAIRERLPVPVAL